MEERSNKEIKADSSENSEAEKDNSKDALSIQSRNYTIQEGYHEIIFARLGVIGYETGTRIENPDIFNQNIIVIHGDLESINEAIASIENIIEERKKQFTFDRDFYNLQSICV